MSLNDDISLLLSFVTNSFITSDESGMCEHILEDNPLLSKTLNCDDKEAVSDEGRYSPDIVPHMDFSGHRFRSNTAIRLDNLRMEKHKQSLVEHVFWDESKLMKDDYIEMFKKHDVIITNKKSSLLSKQILEFKLSNNPFKLFSEFEGKQGEIGVKKFNIYLTMVSGPQRTYPMEIFVNTRARIFQLIGLICWKYTEKKLQPSLKKLEDYCLYLVEDDGEVDSDFPPLDLNELVSKFEFPKLALLEIDTFSARSQSVSSNKKDDTLQENKPEKYPTFIVQQLHRLRPKTTVTLTINPSNVVISSKKFSDFISYSDIINCFIHHRKSTNQVILRLIYNYNDKSTQKDFDCDTLAACQIEASINANLNQ